MLERIATSLMLCLCLATQAPAADTPTLLPRQSRDFTWTADFGGKFDAAFDENLKMDLTKAWGLSFILDVPDDAGIVYFNFFLRSGNEWYKYPVIFNDDSGRISFKAAETLDKKDVSAGLKDISGFRLKILVGDKADAKPFKLGIRDLRIETEEPKYDGPSQEERNAMAMAVPAVPGERHLAWCLMPSFDFDWDSYVKRVSENGITDILALMARNYHACYRSEYLPWDPRDVDGGNKDNLDRYIAACRKYGVKAHVWKVMWKCYSFKEIERTPMLKQIQEEGRMAKVYNWKTIEPAAWLCPTDRKNWELERNAMIELASKGVDGIHFDYIRFEGRKSCYCDRCRAAFEKHLGKKVENWPDDCFKNTGALAEEWDKWRAERISSLIRSVSGYVREHYPSVEISAAIQRYPNCNNAAQNWERWCAEKWVDFVCPMDYTSSARELRLFIPKQKKVFEKTGVPVYPGVGLFSSRSRLDALNCTRQIEALRKAGFPGFTIYSIREEVYPEIEILGKGPLKRK